MAIGLDFAVIGAPGSRSARSDAATIVAGRHSSSGIRLVDHPHTRRQGRAEEIGD
jgi:hypothetical protein